MVGIAVPSFAQEEDSPFSASVSAGLEYDSNITVDSIDSTSNVGDNAFVFDGSLGFDVVDNDDTNFSVGYDFYQSLHDDVDEFDLQIHGFNADVRRSIDRIDLGATYLFNTIKLGDESFLDMHTIRPSVGYLLSNNKVYLTGAYEYQDQSFKQVNLMGRDAIKHSGSLKALFLLGDGRTINTGYTYSRHNALNDGFSYDGQRLEASLKLPFDVANREVTFRGSYRYTIRNYDAESLQFDTEIREDRRHNLRTSLEIPLFSGFFTKVEYEYIDSNSTLASVDYTENITTVSVGWEF